MNGSSKSYSVLAGSKGATATPGNVEMDGPPPTNRDVQAWTQAQQRGALVTVYLPKYGTDGAEVEYDRDVLSVEEGEMEPAGRGGLITYVPSKKPTLTE